MLTKFDGEKKIKPTEIKTNGKNGLHCFLQKQNLKIKTANKNGQCHLCGAEFTYWSRVQKHNMSDT